MADDRLRMHMDDAELQGWLGLSVRCSGCGYITWLFWDLLRRRTPWRRLDDIVPRLTCERCKTPPVSVALLRQREGLPSHAHPRYDEDVIWTPESS